MKLFMLELKDALRRGEKKHRCARVIAMGETAAEAEAAARQDNPSRFVWNPQVTATEYPGRSATFSVYNVWPDAK